MLKSFGIVISLVIIVLITIVNSIPISTISLTSDGSTVVELRNNETVVISMEDVPVRVGGSVDAATGSFHLVTHH